VNYDPNIYMAKQTVRLTLGIWKYRDTREVTLGGNCKGADIVTSAIDDFVQNTMESIEETGQWEYVFADPDGETLSGEIFGEDWADCENQLRNLVLGAEIVAIEPERD
jgi:hypothetical protein